MSRIHPFEQAGLGTAPFKFLGSFRSVYQAIPGDPSCPLQPGSSCDYCGQGITQVCRVRGADGREFKVGNDCVAKVARAAATTEDAKLAAAADAARRKLARQKAHSKARDRKAQLVALLADDATRAQLAAAAHPNEHRARAGATLLDWAEWMLAHSGAAGITRTLKLISGCAKPGGS